ncbi:glycosyltransferase [Arachidicoccus ginsenosidimutans]|uniref:glycosyltransferase n=1 Tax=Arachidicoccus sp. BS20 TaxID=1850526 RepID=UPI0018D45B88|nr:glycosyltransferase family 2 protein [Arachidicoccus sp. BS20]
MKFISVIIPTYKDWERLRLCLDSLKSQTYPQEFFEIIVVNNYPDDTVPSDLVFEKNVKYLVETAPGSYAARNCGLRVAFGEIIAFTDSDCIADKDWLTNAVTLFQNDPKVSRIAGRIQLFYKNPEKHNLVEIYESVYAFRQDKAADIGISVTGNMFCYRYLFDKDKVGIFNDVLLSGGDYEWSVRAQQKGFQIIYGNDVVINHPARNSFKEIVNKSKRLAGSVEIIKKVKFWKFIIPPLRSLSWSKEKQFHIRIIAFLVKYYLNLVRFVESLKILTGIKNPNRV